MKNKKTAFVILPVVLAIWAVIGWKVYAAMRGNGNGFSLSPVNKLKVNPTEKIPDTFHLIASYRDPFLDKPVVPRPQPNSSKKIKPVVPAPLPPPKAAVWPSVAYHGLVKRSSDGKTLGFLTVNGKGHFVKSGDVADEITVGKIWKDSVEVMWMGTKKFVDK